MPVIGRLDGQVDEVLIAPLEGRRRRGGDDDDAPRVSQADLERRAARERFREESTREELPVWLL